MMPGKTVVLIADALSFSATTRELAERGYFALCRFFGRMLRSARYSKVRFVRADGKVQVRKSRLCYAPLLIRLGDPLMKILRTGVRVLPQRDWEERERRIYRRVHRKSVQVDGKRTLVLPRLAGETLASVLDDPKLPEPARNKAIESAVVALAGLHRLGFTHGDAMAENALVDLESGVAHWFDFETLHEASRSTTWQRADDLRALLVTCLLRTAAQQQPEVARLILDAYADERVIRDLTTIFTSVFRRPLTFHLAQAPLDFRSFREIVRLLRERPAHRHQD